jgi:hypothetical protein
MTDTVSRHDFIELRRFEAYLRLISERTPSRGCLPVTYDPKVVYECYKEIYGEE